MEIHGMTPNSLQKAAEELPTTKKKDASLERACKEFESVFLNQLLTNMRKTVPKSDMFGEEENREMETYQGMMDQELAKAWSQADGIGLASILYQQLKKGVS